MKTSFKILLSILIISVMSGCTYFRPKLNEVTNKINNKVIENNSAAKISNEVTEKELTKARAILDSGTITNNSYSLGGKGYTNAMLSFDLAQKSTSLTGELLNRNETLIGKPPEDQSERVFALLSSNISTYEAAARAERYKKNEESKLVTKKEALENKLIEYGTTYEQERNEKIAFWTKWLTLAGIFIGGGIAICVFFPIVIPWVVGMFPKLMHIFGVVGKGVVTNVVAGVGEIRTSLKQETELIKAEKARNPNYVEDKYSTEEVLDLINRKLSENMDVKDKEVVQYLRDKLKY